MVNTNSLCDLTLRSILIESRQGGEVLLRDGRREMLDDHTVRVGRIPDDKHLAVLVRDFVYRFTLSFEYSTVLAQQILPLHSRSTWLRADKYRYLTVLKPFL